MLMQIQILCQYLACDPILQCPKGTAARLQFNLLNSGAVPKWLWCKFWITEHYQDVPRAGQTICYCIKLFSQFVGVGQIT